MHQSPQFCLCDDCFLIFQWHVFSHLFSDKIFMISTFLIVWLFVFQIIFIDCEFFVGVNVHAPNIVGVFYCHGMIQIALSIYVMIYQFGNNWKLWILKAWVQKDVIGFGCDIIFGCSFLKMLLFYTKILLEMFF